MSWQARDLRERSADPSSGEDRSLHEMVSEIAVGVRDMGDSFRSFRSDTNDRLEALESAALQQVAASRELSGRIESTEQKMDEVVKVLGMPPDPSTGTSGSGVRGQVGALINALVKQRSRLRLASLGADGELEGDVTRVQDREALVLRAKSSERAERMLRWRLIAAIVIAALGSIGTVSGWVKAIWFEEPAQAQTVGLGFGTDAAPPAPASR